MSSSRETEDKAGHRKTHRHSLSMTERPKIHRSVSSRSSHASMTTEKSTDDRPNFTSGSALTNYRPKIHRSVSSRSSHASVRTEKSTDDRPNFTSGSALTNYRPKIHRSVSSRSSHASMTTEKSTDDRPNFTSVSALTNYRSKKHGSVSSRSSHTCGETQSPVNDCPSSGSGSENVLRRVIKNHKANLKRKFENISEGIITSGTKTPLSKIFTELYIIGGESEGVNREHEIRQIELASREVSTENTPINCNDIFISLPGQEKHIRTVMTKGVAGIGKTVSVQKFILDWIDGIANQNVDFMFLLPFRELNLVRDDQYNLHSLLLDFHPELKDLCNVEDYTGCQVVFIFDGLDESRLPLNFEPNITSLTQISPVDALMTSLIKGSLLSTALIWITSRPAAAHQIPAQYINQMTEIQGFTDPQKEEYFMKRIHDKHQATKIFSHIKASRSLYIMCHIPVFCWIAATVLQQILTKKSSKDIPKTLTEMFIQFFLIQTIRKGEKFKEKHYKETKLLLESQRETILKLAELAFKNLMNGNLIFYEEDLQDCNIDVTEASVYSGMCTEIFKEESVFRQRKLYSFLHLSIQEFLAAMFVFHSYVTGNCEPLKCFLSEEVGNAPIVSLQSLQGLKLKDLHVLLKGAVNEALRSRNGHLDLFLRFLTGISLEDNQRLLQGLVNQVQNTSKSIKETCQYMKKLNEEGLSPERCINLFHCLAEMNDHSMQKEIQKFLSSPKNIKQKLSPAQCSALAHMLVMSEKELDEFDLSKYNTSNEGRRRLIPAMRCFRKARLACFPLSATTCEAVASVLQSPNYLMELDLSDCEIKDYGIRIISTGLTSTHCKLQTLRLPGCCISKTGCIYLSLALLSDTCHLKELDLSFNHPGELGLDLLSGKVETLKVDNCAEVRLRKGVQKYACKLTLDPNTAHKKLLLSDGNKKVMFVKEKQPYPPHYQRFDYACQVLCREGLSGQWYWEVEWFGVGVHIGMARISIKRKNLQASNNLGCDTKSWCLCCSPQSYSASHNGKHTAIPAPSSGSRRVGVYLDWPAGTLSFYSVSSDTLTNLHTFHSTFTEPLYPAFKLLSTDSFVSLCQIT